MPALDHIIAAQDRLYERHGVAASWTPAGAEAVPCLALLLGGDIAAALHERGAQMNFEVRQLKVRVRELACVSSTTPLKGDAVTVGQDADTPSDQQVSFVLADDPRQEDPRRLEWTFDLAEG